MQALTPIRIRINDVCKLLNLSRTGLEKLIARDKSFPPSYKEGVTPQSPVYFDYHQIHQWHAAKLGQSQGAQS